MNLQTLHTVGINAARHGRTKKTGSAEDFHLEQKWDVSIKCHGGQVMGMYQQQDSSNPQEEEPAM